VKRREFVSLVGGVAAWPLAARAQQLKAATIGLLGTGSAAAQSQWTGAFGQRMRELGWIEGSNLTIEYRWADGHSNRLSELANELVQLKVDVIVTHNTPGPLAAKQATSTIPIVFATAGDPVGAGIVTSLAHPGGNVTACQVRLPILLESVSNSCASWSPACIVWQFWSMWVIRLPLWKSARSRQQRAPSISK